MKNDAEHIEDLLVKYFAGETSVDENREVLAWLELAENRRQFEALKSAWDLSASESNVDVDTDAAWKKVQQRMHAPAEEGIVRNIEDAPGYTRKGGGWLVRIAAVLIPAFVVSFFLWQSGKNNVEQKMLASGDKRIEQTLPDGSVIYLAPQSSIEYPEKFDENARKIKLKGEAFFEITRDTQRPFHIDLEGAKVTVLGTSFNIRAFSKEETEVIVETGKVLFGASNKVTLEKGDRGSLDASGNALKSRSVETDFYSHKTRTLVFENTEMKKVAEVLNSIYQSQIAFENEKIGNCRLTSTFRDEKLDSILDVIAGTFTLTISKEGETVKLSGQGCE